MNLTDLSAQIIAKADSDPIFRQALINDPRATIAQHTGLSLPENLAITVFQETPQRRCLVLPPVTSDELTDEDLASVAGGKEEVKWKSYQEREEESKQRYDKLGKTQGNP